MAEPVAGQDGVAQVEEMANNLRDYSLSMMQFNIQMAKLGVTLDVQSKVANNFMNKPDKVNPTN
jgi:hypothetical protein